MAEENIQLVNLGPIQKIPLGQGLCFMVEKKEVAVFRPRKGGLFAIHNRCPHRRGPLCEGILDAEQVLCPYHNHKFNLKTGQGNEGRERVKSFSVREENGEIVLELKG